MHDTGQVTVLIRQVVEHGVIGRISRWHHAEGVAVIGRLRQLCRADGGIGTGFVFNHDRLPKCLGDGLQDESSRRGCTGG